MKHDDVELLPDVISLEDDGHDIGAEQRVKKCDGCGRLEQMPYSLLLSNFLPGVEELLNTTKPIYTHSTCLPSRIMGSGIQ
jgi:hypothetical protein